MKMDFSLEIMKAKTNLVKYLYFWKEKKFSLCKILYWVKSSFKSEVQK